jgi:hypothetical protein
MEMLFGQRLAHMSLNISEEKRYEFSDIPRTFFFDLVTGFTRVESAPDSLGIYHYIWLSVACIDGRWRADVNMGGFDQWCAFCSITSSVCFIITPEPALSATIQFDIGFTATSILHPATYLNKILVASSEGDMQLWNIRTQ